MGAGWSAPLCTKYWYKIRCMHVCVVIPGIVARIVSGIVAAIVSRIVAQIVAGIVARDKVECDKGMVAGWSFSMHYFIWTLFHTIGGGACR